MEIITLTKEHPYYPDELKETNLTLRAFGNLEILKLKSKRIAVVGSRDATGARGIDTVAFETTIEYNGKFILVIAEGIRNYISSYKFNAVKKHLKNVVVISQYNDYDIWTGYRAMLRNETIIRLSNVILVVESIRVEHSGSFTCGKRALELGKDVYVVNPNLFKIKPAGNVKLIELGAKTLNF
jgi:predicted Rossmann fold nucleotide-binding protein DprA/Smf involved in DNA uptake